jgi:hypothetical protein
MRLLRPSLGKVELDRAAPIVLRAVRPGALSAPLLLSASPAGVGRQRYGCCALRHPGVSIESRRMVCLSMCAYYYSMPQMLWLPGFCDVDVDRAGTDLHA